MENTKHFIRERKERTEFINNVICDKGKVVCKNVIDRGHPNGAERFELTDKGIIMVYNDRTNKHITDLIARPNQIYDRLKDSFLELPIEVRNEILAIAKVHKDLGYNYK